MLSLHTNKIISPLMPIRRYLSKYFKSNNPNIVLQQVPFQSDENFRTWKDKTQKLLILILRFKPIVEKLEELNKLNQRKIHIVQMHPASFPNCL